MSETAIKNKCTWCLSRDVSVYIFYPKTEQLCSKCYEAKCAPQQALAAAEREVLALAGVWEQFGDRDSSHALRLAEAVARLREAREM